MTTISSAQHPTERLAWGKLWWVGLLTIIVAVIANTIVQQIAAVLVRPDPAFGPLTFGPQILFTVVGVLGAVIVFALIGRFSRQPFTLFRRVALIVLIVSIIPDIALLFSPVMPGTTVAAVAVLIVMHIVAWAVTVSMLTRLTRA